jgi:small conductance mechanosensitive channel
MFFNFNPMFLSETVEDMTETTQQMVNDTVQETAETVQKTAQWIIDIMPTLRHIAFLIVECIIIYIIGRRLIKWILKIVNKTFERRQTDLSIARFMDSLLNVLLNAVLVIIMAGVLGVNGSSVVAIVGSAGLTIGMALQGSLSNFAGGILILLLTPFRVGDFISVPGVGEGVVTAIQIFYTYICTGDNRVIIVPNGVLSNASVTNVTHEAIRRLDMEMSVDYTSDIDRVKAVLKDVADSQELILKDQDHGVDIFIDRFDDSAITFGIRMWVNTPDYFALKWKMQEDMKAAFDKYQISIPFNRMDVSMVQEEEA